MRKLNFDGKSSGYLFDDVSKEDTITEEFMDISSSEDLTDDLSEELAEEASFVRVVDVIREGRPTIDLLRNDRVFGIILGNDDIVIPLLSDLTGKKIKRVRRSNVQEHLSGKIFSNTVEVILDYIAETDDGEINVELQLNPISYIHKRSRLYSSMLDLKYATKTGKKKYKLDDNYIIFLNDFGISEDDSPIVRCHTYTEKHVLINDGRTIIYVNITKYASIKGKPYLKSWCQLLNGIEGRDYYTRKIMEQLESFKVSKEADSIMTYEIDREHERELGFYMGQHYWRRDNAKSMAISLKKRGDTLQDIRDILIESVGTKDADSILKEIGML